MLVHLVVPVSGAESMLDTLSVPGISALLREHDYLSGFPTCTIPSEVTIRLASGVGDPVMWLSQLTRPGIVVPHKPEAAGITFLTPAPHAEELVTLQGIPLVVGTGRSLKQALAETPAAASTMTAAELMSQRNKHNLDHICAFTDGRARLTELHQLLRALPTNQTKPKPIGFRWPGGRWGPASDGANGASLRVAVGAVGQAGPGAGQLQQPSSAQGGSASQLAWPDSLLQMLFPTSATRGGCGTSAVLSTALHSVTGVTTVTSPDAQKPRHSDPSCCCCCSCCDARNAASSAAATACGLLLRRAPPALPPPPTLPLGLYPRPAASRGLVHDQRGLTVPTRGESSPCPPPPLGGVCAASSALCLARSCRSSSTCQAASLPAPWGVQGVLGGGVRLTRCCDSSAMVCSASGRHIWAEEMSTPREFITPRSSVMARTIMNRSWGSVGTLAVLQQRGKAHESING